MSLSLPLRRLPRDVRGNAGGSVAENGGIPIPRSMVFVGRPQFPVAVVFEAAFVHDRAESLPPVSGKGAVVFRRRGNCRLRG